MIARIVKMTFQHEKLDQFLEMFENKKAQIRGFEGCTHLQLLKNTEKPNVIYTFSNWLNEQHLEKYRNSALFKETWIETKSYFLEKAEAYTLDQIQEVLI